MRSEVTQAQQRGKYRPPRGRPMPRRPRRPASLRHLAEVITAQRLAPGIAVDKDIVASVLRGDLRYLQNPTVVTAVGSAGPLVG